MKEHGFLFKAEMVTAIRRAVDPKTMTRRPITFDNSITVPHVPRKAWHELLWDQAQQQIEFNAPRAFWTVPFRDRIIRVYPRVQPGDLIWVRETWADLRGMGFGNHPDTDKPFEIAYAADTRPGSEGDDIRKQYGVKWKPSIHMPRWASRIDLNVLAMRSQRIQDISNKDARAEGVEFESADPPFYYVPGYWPHSKTAVDTDKGEAASFAKLWDIINAKRGYGWDTNHPVWIYEFKRVKGK